LIKNIIPYGGENKMENRCKDFFSKFRPVVHIPMIIGGVIIMAGLALLFGFIVMWLWNWLMPEIFGLPEISYWQGWGLVVLAHILFKSMGGSHDHDGIKKNIKKELKTEFKKEFEKEFKEEMRREYEKKLKDGETEVSEPEFKDEDSETSKDDNE
jgi:hypothetical protein